MKDNKRIKNDYIGNALQILYGLEQAKGYPHGFAVISPAELTDLIQLLKKDGDE